MRLLISILLLAGSVAAKDPEWIRLKTPNFELYTTAGEKKGREAILYLETIHGFYQSSFAKTPPPALPTRVILFKNEKQYRDFSPSAAAAAFYQAGYYRDYIILHSLDADSYPIVIHEYTHLFFHAANWELPPWMDEGMAEFYSTIKAVGKKVRLGDVIEGRVPSLRQGVIPLEQLVTVDHRSPYYNERNRAGTFYAESWLLCHMLAMSNAYRPKFGQFFMQMAQTQAPLNDVLMKIYGVRVADVQRDFDDYYRGNTAFYHITFDVQMEKYAEAPDIDAPRDVEVGTMLAEIEAIGSRREKGEARLAGLAKELGETAEVEELKGYMAWHDSRRDEAIAHFQKALSLGSKNFKLAYDCGRLMQVPKDRVALFQKAIELKPDFGDAYVDLAIAATYAKQYPTAAGAFGSLKSVKPSRAAELFIAKGYLDWNEKQAEMAERDVEQARRFAKKEWELVSLQHLEDYLKQAKEYEAQVASQKGRAAKRVEAPVPELAAQAPLRARDNWEELNRPMGAGDQAVNVGEVRQKVKGLLRDLDCSGPTPRVKLETEGHQTVVFMFDDPKRVSIRGTGTVEYEFTCGAQKGQTVMLEYVPQPGPGVSGIVRVLDFAPVP